MCYTNTVVHYCAVNKTSRCRAVHSACSRSALCRNRRLLFAAAPPTNPNLRNTHAYGNTPESRLSGSFFYGRWRYLHCLFRRSNVYRPVLLEPHQAKAMILPLHLFSIWNDDYNPLGRHVFGAIIVGAHCSPKSYMKKSMPISNDDVWTTQDSIWRIKRWTHKVALARQRDCRWRISMGSLVFSWRVS